jgi:ABC-type glycerol-3-phosphate transport system substrate-binding protein
VNYSLLYYRKDILEDLGLAVPQTWEEFYHAIKVLQNENLSVSVVDMDAINPTGSLSLGMFFSFLFQHDGQIYNEDRTRTMFDSPQAMDAFEDWVNLYKLYGLDQQLDFLSRMRSGEAPLGIAGQTVYPLLAGVAPELAGLWDIAPLPGTLLPDGTIDRTVSCEGLGSIILKLAEGRGMAENAYKFIHWWTSPEVQGSYGNENEMVIGVTARYFPAAKEAFEMIGWTPREAAILKAQWEWTQGVPPAPGNYMLGRSLTTALRYSIDNTYETRRALSIYNRDMNYELERKTIEFEKNYED